MNNEQLTNKQLQDMLNQINLLLGTIAVSGDNVFTLADCRNALKQIVSALPADAPANAEEA